MRMTTSTLGISYVIFSNSALPCTFMSLSCAGTQTIPPFLHRLCAPFANLSSSACRSSSSCTQLMPQTNKTHARKSSGRQRPQPMHTHSLSSPVLLRFAALLSRFLVLLLLTALLRVVRVISGGKGAGARLEGLASKARVGHVLECRPRRERAHAACACACNCACDCDCDCAAKEAAGRGAALTETRTNNKKLQAPHCARKTRQAK